MASQLWKRNLAFALFLHIFKHTYISSMSKVGTSFSTLLTQSDFLYGILPYIHLLI